MSTILWWESRRKRYNFGLVIAGVLAWISYAAVCTMLLPRVMDPDQIEIGAIETVAQGVVYLAMMGVANICYFLGPASEPIIRPANVDRYRRITFGSGFWFSVLLPFSIPGLLALLVVFCPGYFDWSLRF